MLPAAFQPPTHLRKLLLQALKQGVVLLHSHQLRPSGCQVACQVAGARPNLNDQITAFYACCFDYVLKDAIVCAEVLAQ
jgi:hypothetical protein